MPSPVATHVPAPDRESGRKPWSWRRAGAGVAALVVAAVCAGSAAGAGAGTAVPGGAFGVDATRCGAPGGRLPAGRLAFTVTDRATPYATVYLTSPDGAEVYAEIPWIAPGHTVALNTALSAGSYAFRCVFSDGTVRTSRPLAVAGRTDDAVAGYRPVPDLAMTAPVNAYRAWVAAALPGLLTAARALDSAVAHGDLAAARSRWLTAHLAYERLGAAYTAFGDFDDAIDGRADGLPQGVDSPDWTGFHRIEYDLWHGHSAADLRPLTTRLVSDVAGLIRDFPSEDVDPGDLPLRSHEILENAMQFQLTGAADYGSGTTLATLDANLDGTREVLGVLTPLLRPRDPRLASSLTREVSAVQAQVRSCRSANGTWIPVRQLTATQFRSLEGDLGGLLEQLAEVPGLLAPRTSA
ncbi:EfeM/EfeO family lipoprotein [Streptomyces sp. PTM05]|uniref:EfeM/EfeO family lipoprotein n=1 Tax=Streptantibioticus parmotrematis TaxID=2873249 RepID=A0ABS7QQL6_9ACTN|nr:EfeM/EfeO family lipoprotein [Streptantibioticus parmotrematis]MBY8885486.1 EfeM/EfeO family lipoprotein [Streptantibioticus parmotrematis]